VNRGAKTITDREIEGSVGGWEYTDGRNDAHIDSSSTPAPEEVHPDGVKVTAITGHEQV
jgi:hypothetical protein